VLLFLLSFGKTFLTKYTYILKFFSITLKCCTITVLVIINAKAIFQV